MVRRSNHAKVNTQAATNYGETVREVSKPISPPKAVEQPKPVTPAKVESAKPVTPANNWQLPPVAEEKVVKPKGSANRWLWAVVGIPAAIFIFLVLFIGWGFYLVNQETAAKAEARINARATADVNVFKDKHGVPMIKIPAGPFQMGSDKRSDDEKPVHAVTLAEFYIDKYEVTNAQYAACVQARKCTPPHDTSSSSRKDYYGNTAYQDYPVIQVDWSQAKAYCEWRGGRLPTEAEWEKAARGTDGRTYPWGNEEPNDTLLNYYGTVGDTTSVGSYPKGASPYGVMDMAGNVWEWVSSDYKPYPYKADDGREDLLSNNNKVIRGGSWNDFVNLTHATFRDYGSPIFNDFIVGSRCVR